MLKELYYYLSTPCRKPLRQLGYLSALIAIQARYQRVANAWQPHIKHCEALIREASEQCQQHRKVVILGSGLLLDIPLKYLSKHFTEVVLLDIAHLRVTVKHAACYGNVTLLEHDITGLSEALINYHPNKPLPTPTAYLPLKAQQADLIISANLLSQLPLIPSQYLQKHFSIDDEILQAWQCTIISDHLRLLTEQTGQCCLISDTAHDYLNSEDILMEHHSMLHDLGLGQPDQQWRWPIAPLGELNSKQQLIATVQGFYNWTSETSNNQSDSQ